jgi:hypothetical protein
LGARIERVCLWRGNRFIGREGEIDVDHLKTWEQVSHACALSAV